MSGTTKREINIAHDEVNECVSNQPTISPETTVLNTSGRVSLPKCIMRKLESVSTGKCIPLSGNVMADLQRLPPTVSMFNSENSVPNRYLTEF